MKFFNFFKKPKTITHTAFLESMYHIFRVQQKTIEKIYDDIDNKLKEINQTARIRRNLKNDKMIINKQLKITVEYWKKLLDEYKQK